MLERRALIEEEGVVFCFEEVRGPFEGSNQHPVKGEGGEDRERGDDCEMGGASTPFLQPPYERDHLMPPPPFGRSGGTQRPQRQGLGRGRGRWRRLRRDHSPKSR